MEEDLYEDGAALVDFFVEKELITLKKTLFWGQGMGSAIALKLAGDYKVEAVFLESFFPRAKSLMPGVLKYVIPSFVMRYELDNYQYVRKVEAPIFMIQSKDDRLVDIEEIQAFASTLTQPVTKLSEGKGKREEVFWKRYKAHKGALRDFWIDWREWQKENGK